MVKDIETFTSTETLKCALSDKEILERSQLLAQHGSSNTGWEQGLGRLARPGQRSPRVDALFFAHTPELRAAYREARRRAEYVQLTSGSAQKLAYGSDDEATSIVNDCEGLE